MSIRLLLSFNPVKLDLVRHTYVQLNARRIYHASAFTYIRNAVCLFVQTHTYIGAAGTSAIAAD